MNNLEQYLTEEGFALSQDMVRADIPTNSEVQSVKVLDVERARRNLSFHFSGAKITEGKRHNRFLLHTE